MLKRLEESMRIFAKTDIGRERKLDEDYFYASKAEDKIKLFILADGMVFLTVSI